ncbi:MAG: hypothetical protein FWC57_04240 [Endomicrobia bacterium]|nr:hypothetical protein [Endomicrobiia bacterium]
MNLFKSSSQNKEYLAGLLFVVATTAIAMLLFFDKSLALQEGWYSIYAKNIIDHGMMPYRDFSLIVTPLPLYVWTLIQYIFGDNFIVFHIADIFSKMLMGALLYHICTKFFSHKIAALSAFCSQSVLIAVIYDNGVLSYNEYWVILMFVMIILMMAQTKRLENAGIPDNKLSAVIGIVYTLAFLNKQSAGPVNIMVSVALLCFFIYIHSGIKNAVKSFFIMFASSAVSLFILFGYFIFSGALPGFINDVFMSYGAKGGFSTMFAKVTSLIFTYPFSWPVFVSLVILFIYFMIAKKLKPVTAAESGKQDGDVKFIAIAFLAFLASVAFSYITVKYFISPLHDITGQNNLFMQQFSTIGLFYFIFIALYYVIKAFMDGDFSYSSSRYFIISFMFLSAVFINSISHGLPNTYPYIGAFVFGYALNAGYAFNKIKNFLLYAGLAVICLFALMMKLQSPAVFHGWKSGSVTGELAESFIPKLKGLKLPVEEKNMYEDIYEKVHKYTTAEDTILVFNNNQVFYELLERKPYTEYISLYYDVSPNYQSLEILENLKSNPPKAVVFFKFSEASEKFHEEIFRSGDKSGQRALGKYLSRLEEDGEYVAAADYKSEEMIDKNKFPEKMYPDYEKYVASRKEFEELKEAFKNTIVKDIDPIDDKLISLSKEISKLKKEMKKARYVKNSFIGTDYELKLLIRSDIYKNINDETDKK